MATTQTTVILNSWKEIASYLGRGVRTVQRYERDFQLPVRRVQGKSHASVLALSKDIDNWLARTPLHGLESDETEDPSKWDVLQEHQMAISTLACRLRVLNERLAESRRIRNCQRWFGAEN